MKLYSATDDELNKEIGERKTISQLRAAIKRNQNSIDLRKARIAQFEQDMEHYETMLNVHREQLKLLEFPRKLAKQIED